MTDMTKNKPKAQNSESAKELDRAQEQFEKFDQDVKSMTLDRMNMAKKEEVEPQTKISQQDLSKMTDVYLKPKRRISCSDKFNEKFRESYEFDKEYVNFTAENKEIGGETINIWTRPYGGMPAEEWEVPVNKPIWGPRYLAEQIKRKNYHRLVMQETRGAGQDSYGQYYGAMAVDTIVQRLDAHPISKRRSIFMGGNF